MAFLSAAPLFSSMPLLRRFPATTVAASIKARTGFRICLGASCITVKTNCNEEVISRSILRRPEQFEAVFHSVRARSSVSEQGVVEETRERIPNSRRLILYSKPGCCLCDGLKEKLESGDAVAAIQLEVRDITTNSEWWNSYQYEIPVLARVRDDGTEEPLPRISPRLSADQVQKKIHGLMTSVA